MRTFLLVLIVILTLSSCSKNEGPIIVEEDPIDQTLKSAITKASKTGDLAYYIMPESDDYAALPHQDPNNPITAEKVALGKLLFFETGLAQTPMFDDCYETYSCSSCHHPDAGFLPGRIQGIADGGFGYGPHGSVRLVQDAYEETEIDAQGTRPMNSLNAGYSTNTLWSGTFGATGVNVGTEENWTDLAEVNHTGFMGLEAQNIEAFDLHRMAINDRVLDDFGYRPYFDKAFPDFKEAERYSPTTASFAIGAYLRSKLTNRAPFQKYLKGEDKALTENQKQGALLFFGKARCSNCHKSPALGAMNFHALGTKDMYEMGGLNTSADDPRNLGRATFTGKEEDKYRFKVPQLYNLRDYATYFHGSSKSSLEELIEFKVNAKSENPQVADSRLSPLFRPLDLTQKEKDQLIDFLRNGLYDAETDRYVPESVLSGYCFPNNDAASKKDLGCE
jgi:cytochrome c peroxidase